MSDLFGNHIVGFPKRRLIYCFHSTAFTPNEPRHEKTGLQGFPTRSDTNRPVQLQKKARILKFWIEVEEELYYSCSENKDDHFRSYCEADLRYENCWFYS